MNLNGERDYSAVRTPVLGFLIQHELYRIELAERFGAPLNPVSRCRQRDIAKAKATYRERRRKKWEAVFKALDWRAGTSAVARQVGQSNVVINSTMKVLLEDGFVVKDGTIPHPGNGRPQTVWKWVR